MDTYPNLPTPAGRWAKRCACGQPAALVRDGRTWCADCHMLDLRSPVAHPPAWVPPALHEHRPSRAIRHRRSGRRDTLRDQGNR